MSFLSFGKSKKEKNINLLPEETGESFDIKKDLVLALLTPIATIVLLGFIFATLFLLEKQQAIKNDNINKEINEKTSTWKKLENIAGSIKTIQTGFDLYKTQDQQNKKIIDTIKAIQEVIPDTVKLAKLDIKEKGSVTLDGTALKPATIYQLVEDMKSKSETFADPKLGSIGISDDEGSKKYTFSVSVTVKDK